MPFARSEARPTTAAPAPPPAPGSRPGASGAPPRASHGGHHAHRRGVDRRAPDEVPGAQPRSPAHAGRPPLQSSSEGVGSRKARLGDPYSVVVVVVEVVVVVLVVVVLVVVVVGVVAVVEVVVVPGFLSDSAQLPDIPREALPCGCAKAPPRRSSPWKRSPAARGRPEADGRSC
jgi:hypothetical protein